MINPTAYWSRVVIPYTHLSRLLEGSQPLGADPLFASKQFLHKSNPVPFAFEPWRASSRNRNRLGPQATSRTNSHLGVPAVSLRLPASKRLLTGKRVGSMPWQRREVGVLSFETSLFVCDVDEVCRRGIAFQAVDESLSVTRVSDRAYKISSSMTVRT